MSNSKSIMVSAPGKIHLIGEHVVVYGKPAIIAAIDKRCFISIKPRNDKKIQIISKNYDLDLSISLDKLAIKRDNARKSWQIFIDTKDTSFLTSITKEPLDYPFLVIGEVLKFYDASLDKGFSLEIDSQIPIGSGSGSSSAIAVAIASAITLFLGKPLDKEMIFNIAVKAEELKHGTPSGGDPATVLHGGLIWFQKISATEKIIRPIDLKISQAIASHFYLVDTGKPNESTGEMIAIAREFKNKYPEETKTIFDEQEKLTKQLLKAMQEDNSTSIIYIIEAAEKNLEKLGVVSEYVTSIIRAIEKSGGVAKISGGGGKTKSTGMLLVYHEDVEKLRFTLALYNLKAIHVTLGTEGLRKEI
jgi:mevalonate kinase